jgi:hypothetical protein
MRDLLINIDTQPKLEGHGPRNFDITPLLHEVQINQNQWKDAIKFANGAFAVKQILATKGLGELFSIVKIGFFVPTTIVETASGSKKISRGTAQQKIQTRLRLKTTIEMHAYLYHFFQECFCSLTQLAKTNQVVVCYSNNLAHHSGRKIFEHLELSDQEISSLLIDSIRSFVHILSSKVPKCVGFSELKEKLNLII